MKLHATRYGATAFFGAAMTGLSVVAYPQVSALVIFCGSLFTGIACAFVVIDKEQT